jgi:hypothetical protein
MKIYECFNCGGDYTNENSTDTLYCSPECATEDKARFEKIDQIAVSEHSKSVSIPSLIAMSKAREAPRESVEHSTEEHAQYTEHEARQNNMPASYNKEDENKNGDEEKEELI